MGLNKNLTIVVSKEFKQKLPTLVEYYKKNSVSEFIRWCVDLAEENMKMEVIPQATINNLEVLPPKELLPPSKIEVIPLTSNNKLELLPPIINVEKEVIPQVLPQVREKTNGGITSVREQINNYQKQREDVQTDRLLLSQYIHLPECCFNRGAAQCDCGAA
jgi:hypothetical protein